MSRTRIGDAVEGRDHEVVEGPRLGDAAHRAQRRLVEAGRHVAARQVGVLAHDGVAHAGDRDLVRDQPVGVDPDVDGAEQAADDPDLADAGRALELRADDLVGDLGQLAEGAVARTARW